MPTHWFRNPLDTAIKSAVRPATALTPNSTQGEIKVQATLPREVFEDFMSPLGPEDAAGLELDPITGWLKPTHKTQALRHFDYEIKRGSVSDRLFHIWKTWTRSPRRARGRLRSWRRSATKVSTRSSRSPRSARRRAARSTS